MQKTIFILLLFLPMIGHTQEFEGIVKYKMKYQSKNPAFSVELMEKGLGTETILYIKNGAFKEVSNSVFMSFIMFFSEEAKLSFKHDIQDDTLRYLANPKSERANIPYEITPNADTILGVVCDKLVTKNADGITTYFYSQTYPLDPDFYRNYPDESISTIRGIMGAIELRLIFENENFIMESNAVEVSRTKLAEEEFRLPEHTVLVQEK